MPLQEPLYVTGNASVRRSPWWALPVLCVSLLLISMDTTILNVALPTLVRVLHASMTQLQWIMDSYLLVFGATILVAGSMGDRFGRKPFLQAGLIVFAAGSAMSAMAGSADTLIATRAFMGLGAALIMPATLSILTNTFTDHKERAKALGVWSAMNGIGVVVGPVLGGLLLEHFWWGSVFLINVPIAIAGLIAGAVVLRNSLDSRAMRPDLAGAVLSLGGLGAILLGLIQSATWGWTSPGVALSLVGGIVLLGFMVLLERKSDHPMLDVKIFTDRRFSAAAISISLGFFSLMGMLFLITQLFQFVLGYPPLEAGLRMAPLAIPLVIAAGLSPKLDHVAGSKVVVASGLTAIFAGLIWMSTVSNSTSYGMILGGLLLVGLGLGLMMPVAVDCALGSLPLEKAGAGSALNSAMIQIGSALGIAVLGAVEESPYRSAVMRQLAGSHFPASIMQFINGSVGGALTAAHLMGSHGGTALAHVAITGFDNGTRSADLLGAGVIVIAVLVTIVFLPSRRQHGDLVTSLDAVVKPLIAARRSLKARVAQFARGDTTRDIDREAS
ncbi:MAG: MFS transporter [Acidimicrobiales bacterium]